MSNQSLPMARTKAEMDSAHIVLGQAFGVLSKELLSGKPDALKLRHAQRVIGQIQGALAQQTAETQASRMDRMEPRTGASEPVRAKSSAVSRREMPTPQF